MTKPGLRNKGRVPGTQFNNLSAHQQARKELQKGGQTLCSVICLLVVKLEIYIYLKYIYTIYICIYIYNENYVDGVINRKEGTKWGKD